MRPLGVIIGAHGLRGLVKVKTEAENFKALLEKQPITLRDTTHSAKVTGATSSPYIVELSGVTDRNAAELLKGAVLYAVDSTKPKSKDTKEYIVDELIGLTIEENSNPIGTITKMYNFGAGEIAEITYTDGKTEMFPFNARTFPEVDIAAKRAVFARPEDI